MRMVIFSIILMLVIIFARRGVMGRQEFSWDWLFSTIRRTSSRASEV
jgi:branched-chain amino acid transport system permease protein